jgi:hypothetical protein
LEEIAEGTANGHPRCHSFDHREAPYKTIQAHRRSSRFKWQVFDDHTTQEHQECDMRAKLRNVLYGYYQEAKTLKKAGVAEQLTS